MNMTQKEVERFSSKWVGDGDCWLWQGPLDKDGYGSFFFRGTSRRAHRVAWYSMNGEIPAGHVINHTCRNRNCVNPQHLNCITVRENSLRDSASASYVNSQKTTCPQGHPYDGVEVSRGKSSRICTRCRTTKRAAARKRAYRAAKASLSV